MIDLLDQEVFEGKIRENLKEKNFIFEQLFKVAPIDPETIFQTYLPLADFFRPYVTNVSLRIDEALREGQNVLFEGAQGTHLDVDHGTYPYVTSSNPVAGGVCAGAGLGPNKIRSVVGIVKAYTTRVGGGPFTVELHDDTGLLLREKGGEYGATTGRPRRCGWLDTVVLRDSARLNGLTELALTKLDVLSGLKTIKICTAYSCEGQEYRQVPALLKDLERCRPVYEELEGWPDSLRDIRRFADLPPAAQQYIRRLEELVGVPVGIISVGPGREETIAAGNPFVVNN
jgi:adenylosuccinate synthase